MSERIELAEFPKSKRASIRIGLDHYKGRKVIDIRIWSQPNYSETLLPSRKGITVDANLFANFVDAMNAAADKLTDGGH